MDFLAHAHIFRSDLPQMVAVDIQTSARYLGFLIGPGHIDAGWVAAVEKFALRTAACAALHASMNWAMLAYNTFCMSVFSFLGQLDSPSDAALQVESWARRVCVLLAPETRCFPAILSACVSVLACLDPSLA